MDQVDSNSLRKADLHIHTIASDDATLEPEQVFRLAKEQELAAVAFTDHDNIGAIEEGQRLSAVYGMAFMPGIEMASLWRGQLAHILGYFPDGICSSFNAFLAERHWPARRTTDLALLERLQQRGVSVTKEEYEDEARSGGYHLPLFRLLLRKGLVSSVEEYAEMRAAVGWEFFYLPITEVIQAVHEAHGIAVLAHPAWTGVDFYQFDAEAIGLLAIEGLDGLEVFHPVHVDLQVDYYSQTADRLGLVKTGGSDSHSLNVSHHDRIVGDVSCDWDEVLRFLAGQS